MKFQSARRTVAAAALAVAFLVPSQPAHMEDDTSLFSVNVQSTRRVSRPLLFCWRRRSVCLSVFTQAADRAVLAAR